MRTTRFRAWDGKKMHVVTELHLLESGSAEVLIWDNTGGLDGEGGQSIIGCTCVEDCKIQKRYDLAVILMQFTGLKDKNGVEIYEGDVVNVVSSFRKGNITGTIVWNDKLLRLEIRAGGRSSGVKWINWLLEKSATIEVIGNIHENPELLEAPHE